MAFTYERRAFVQQQGVKLKSKSPRRWSASVCSSKQQRNIAATSHLLRHHDRVPLLPGRSPFLCVSNLVFSAAMTSVRGDLRVFMTWRPTSTSTRQELNQTISSTPSPIEENDIVNLWLILLLAPAHELLIIVFRAEF